jgi:hypothetical protein
MFFVQNNWPINTIRSNWLTGWGKKLEFDHAALQKRDIY